MAHLALAGGPRQRGDKKWPDWPVRGAEERALVDEVVTTGPWSYEGPREKEFEATFAAYCGARHGFCVANGTVSIEIALRAGGVKPGDEVIVPALTWIATASAALYMGATVVFADVDPDTYQLDPARAEQAITERTRAIIPVHLYGRLADMDAMADLGRRHNLLVIEDCAHGHGGIWRGQKTGSMGDLGSFSFQESKVITSGEGGFITTNDDELAELVYGLKNCGRSRQPNRRRYVLGGSYRMTELQAALLLAQFTRLDEQVNHRDRNGRWLDGELARIEGIRPLHRDPRIERQSYYAYVFRYDAAAFGGLPVEVFRTALEAEGIPCGPTYGPVYATDLWGPAPYERWRIAFAEVADRVDDEAVLLAHEMLLGDEDDMADIVEAVRKIQAHRDELAGLEVEKPRPASVAAPRRGIPTA
jgi:L-glutamine:2-deoxy-scyllo-inosose/3-amino-2,3-dideoxy-scyllo-inosose aminotransferase